MNAYLALLIPIFFSIIAFIIWSKKLTWWEVILPVAVSFIFIQSMKWGCISSNVADTEYLSTYALKVSYEEPWNEYIHKTCTREYSCGTDSKGHTKYCTETYDCSYVDYHGAKYYVTCQNGSSYSVTQQKYDELVKKWGNTSFVDMHRHYHSIDGDKYVSNWNGNIKTIYTADWTQSYDNRIQASHSIYNFNEVSDSDKVHYQLYEYPSLGWNNQTNAVLSNKSFIFQKEKDDINAINGLLGSSKKIHVWILIWENMSDEVADYQQSYWKGGNKNELVICIGVDKKRHVKWNRVFTWSDKNIVKIKIRNYLNSIKNERLDFDKLQPFLITEINSDWVKKNWHDFDFLDVQMTDSQNHWLYVLTILISLGSIAYGVMNEFENDSDSMYYTGKKKYIKQIVWKDKSFKSLMSWIRKRMGTDNIESND